MSRTLAQLTQISCLFAALGCASPEAPVAPMNASGSTSTSGGGSGQTGGTSSEPSATTEPSTGGAGNPSGGAANPTGGAKATGGAGPTGGVVATGGASSSVAGQIVLKLTLAQNAGANDPSQGTLWVTLAPGVANIPAASLKFTLCGAGEGTMPSASALNVNDGRLVCPSSNDLGTSCGNGENVTLNSGSMPIKVTGQAQACCFSLDLSGVNKLLAQGGHIELHYMFNTGAGINGLQKENQTWSALVSGQTAAKCTVGTWDKSYPVSCG